MSHQFSGMDVAQIRSLAGRMRTEAGEIEGLIHSLTGRLSGVAWKGQDRERFISEWQLRHVVALRRVADGLQNASAQADQHADQQEWASRA
ncbi:MAG: hypothetical protein JWM47_2093 [Acidimicrobiales bacterium]|nr:hypothetical protein [Acidimicrobiales bacterium]